MKMFAQHPVPRRPVTGLIWDFDGTVVDTREKNLRVTRTVVEQIAHKDPDIFPALRSLEAYTRSQTRSVNWRDFYRQEFEFPEELIDQAGRMWGTFQVNDSTPTPVFSGIHAVLHELRAFPHGIVSQNARDAIERELDHNNLRQYFSVIIGCEEVDIRRQKPFPDGIVRCIEGLISDIAGVVLSIGDHETDTACARNANAVLRRTQPELSVSSVGAAYSSPSNITEWKWKPDYIAFAVNDIVAIVNAFTPWRLAAPSAKILNNSSPPEV